MEKNKGTNVFSNRNYRLLFLEGLISEMGYAVYSFAVSFYLLDISGNNAMLQGIFLAACSVAGLIAMPFGGVIGDRYNKSRVMMLCDIARGTLVLITALVTVMTGSKTAQMAVFFAVGVIGSAAAGIFAPASSALLPYIVEDDRIQQASSYSSVRTSLTGILGSALAAMLYSLLPIPVLFLGVGICYIAAGITAMLIRYEEGASGGRISVRDFFSDMKDGFTYMAGRKALMSLITAIIFINFFMSPVYSNFVPYFIRTDLPDAGSYILDSILPPEMWSSVFSILLSVSSLIGSVIMSARKQEERVGKKTALRLCMTAAVMICVTAAYMLLTGKKITMSAFLVTLSLASSVLGILTSFINIPITTVLMRMVDRDKLSKVSSITSTMSQCMLPLSSLMAGAVLQKAGSAPLLCVCTAGFTAVALMLMFGRETDNI